MWLYLPGAKAGAYSERIMQAHPCPRPSRSQGKRVRLCRIAGLERKIAGLSLSHGPALRAADVRFRFAGLRDSVAPVPQEAA